MAIASLVPCVFCGVAPEAPCVSHDAAPQAGLAQRITWKVWHSCTPAGVFATEQLSGSACVRLWNKRQAKLEVMAEAEREKIVRKLSIDSLRNTLEYDAGSQHPALIEFRRPSFDLLRTRLSMPRNYVGIVEMCGEKFTQWQPLSEAVFNFMVTLAGKDPTKAPFVEMTGLLQAYCAGCGASKGFHHAPNCAMRRVALAKKHSMEDGE